MFCSLRPFLVEAGRAQSRSQKWRNILREYPQLPPLQSYLDCFNLPWHMDIENMEARSTKRQNPVILIQMHLFQLGLISATPT